MSHTPHDHSSLRYPTVRPYGPRRKIGTFVLMAVIFLTGIGVLIVSTTIRFLIDDLRRYSTLNAGQRTEAVIIDRYVDEDQQNTYRYLTYQFEIDGESFEKDAEVDKLLYDVYKEGMTITVVYRPEEPSNSMLATTLREELQVVWLVIIVFPLVSLSVPAILLLIWWWLFRRLPAKLRKHGVVTTGTIIACWEERQGPQRMIAYTFQPQGAVEPIRGKERVPDSEPAFAPGDSIDIRYLAHKPNIFMLEWEYT